MTTVTLITPCRNAAPHIERCIESVRSQSYPHIEHIFCDGGSTDGTVEILEREGCDIVSKRDAGIYDAMNIGIGAAKPKSIVGILSSNDYLANAQVISGIVASMERLQLEVIHGLIRMERSNIELGTDADLKDLESRMVVAHPSVFVRKSVYEKYGGFSVGFRIAADHEMMLRIWPKVKRSFVPEVFVVMSEGGLSKSAPRASYQESMAAAVLHGRNPLLALADFATGLLRHHVSVIVRRGN